MSEEERRRYLEENSQALEDLMDVDLDELDDQTREQVESAIIRLAVPDVDPSDGEGDAETVEEALSDEEMADEMAEAFGRSSEISDGLDSLEDWAASNEVDLEESEAVSGAMGYLGAFHRATYARRDEVTKYLEDGVRTGGLWPFTEEYEQAATDEQLETIRQGWADGLLTLSREDYGGGWDELPEGVQEAQTPPGTARPTWRAFEGFRELTDILSHGQDSVAPGDDLAIAMARTARYAMNPEVGGTEQASDQQLSTAFALTGRNEAASAALLAGTDGVDGFEGTRFPEAYDQSTFIAAVFDHEWEDGGAGVAGLIDWISSGDELSERPEDAWYGLMETVTSAGDDGDAPDVFGQLMGEAGSGAFEQNDALAESFVGTTVANLEEIALADGKFADGLGDTHHVRIMALASSNDEAAQLLSAEVQRHHAAAVAEVAGGGEDSDAAGQKVGILQSKYEGGVYAEARYSDLSAEEANARVLRLVQFGAGVVSSVMPNPASGLGDAVFQQLDLGESSVAPMPFVDDVSPQYRSELLRARARIWMMESLGGESLDGFRTYVGPEAVLPERLRDNLDQTVLDGLEEGKGLSADQLVGPYGRTVLDDLEAFDEEHEVDLGEESNALVEAVDRGYTESFNEYSREFYIKNVFAEGIQGEGDE